MASLYEAIFTAIKEDPALSAKLSAGGGKYHIYRFNLPDGALPFTANYAITFGQVSSRKITDLDIELPLFQFNCIGKLSEHSLNLKEDLKALLERFKGNLGNKRIVQFVHSINEKDLLDPDTKLYISYIEIRVKLFGNNV